MTHQEFIDAIAVYVKKYAPEYGILVHSPVIAQGCLESGFGETRLARDYHNYHGLKCGTRWKGKSLNLKTQEEYTEGTLTTITDNFRVYDSMDDGVRGYFDFLQLPRYQNLRGITDPEEYLKTIKADGYATDSKYVEKNLKLIRQYDLTKYDAAEGSREENDLSKIETAIQWMENKAKDSKVGYDQIYRWGEKGDYDCSAAVITAWESAGVPVKTKGATYTGNMLPVFLLTGFKDITSSVNRKTGAGLKRGDVLLNTGHHTAMYCGDGLEVEASINEKGTATGGKPGDQTGKEFLIRSYRNYPWTNILRYTGENVASTSVMIILRKGSTGEEVRTMQKFLILCGYDCGSSGADGDFGTNTYKALLSFQKDHNLIADGEYGSQSNAALYSAATEAAAQNVLAGKYGNGDERKGNIESLGLSYKSVQTRVNEILKGQKSVDEIAREVLAGKWGNGASRKRKITEAGYDYSAVQKRVNEISSL